MTDARFSRRLFCLAALAGTATPALAQQVSRTRSFDIFRDGSNIGEHVVQVEAVDGGLRATTHIDIAVKVLGFTAYRYGMDYQESYDGQGRLTGLSGTANDDGKRGHVEVSRVGNALEIDGSSYSGEAPGLAMPTSYWRPSSLDRTPWISTQTGLLLPVTVSPTEAGEAPDGASGYRVSDGDEFVVDLFYDARGEWIGTAFDAGGERAVYRLRDDTGALNI